MKVMCNIVSVVTFSVLALSLSLQSFAVEIIGGGGNAAEKLILDWSNAKSGNRANTIKFVTSNISYDLNMLQSGKIDFAILDSPLSDTELARLKLLQIPFALNGVSIVVNLQNTMAGTLKLDGQTLGKIFSGEITNWDDSAITALNPKHDLPNKQITVIHSGEFSTDYSIINSYIGNINEKWKAGDLNGKKREWPANSIYAEGFATRISTIKNTPYSIGFLPMQYMPQPALSAIHIKNRDGNIIGLSDTNIIASASSANLDDGQSASLSLINKSGNTSWPISSFAFVVVNRDSVKDEKIVQLLSVISYGLKTGSLKPTIHNYVAIPEQLSKSIIAKIETLTAGANTATAGRSSSAKTSQENAQDIANKKRIDEELHRQRTDANTTPQDEKNRAAKQIADEMAREQAIKEAKAAKLAAEEAIKAANAAKLQAEQLAEKNRLIAKAEKERADKEQAERENAEREKAEKERAIQLRNQKDEDPLEAYRRSVK